MKIRSVLPVAVLALSLAPVSWAQERRAAPAPTVSEGELCSQGDAAACARGREKWISLESCQQGTARRTGP